MKKSYKSPKMDLQMILFADVIMASTDGFGSNAYDNGYDLGQGGLN